MMSSENIVHPCRKDDQRAGEVIDRMRGLLKRREVERRRLNINLPAGEIVALVRPDATMRGVRLVLGLAISRSIIEAHGGRLWAENNPDGGATFRFTVPVSDEGLAELIPHGRAIGAWSLTVRYNTLR